MEYLSATALDFGERHNLGWITEASSRFTGVTEFDVEQLDTAVVEYKNPSGVHDKKNL